MIRKVPDRVKRFLIGAELTWHDNNPMSDNMEEDLLYQYQTNSSKQTDLLLQKYGIWSVEYAVNANLIWEVEIQMQYSLPNHAAKSHHIDHHWFSFKGPMFPMCDKFKQERDNFYLLKNLEHELVPADNKNKGYYEKSIFIAKVVGI